MAPGVAQQSGLDFERPGRRERGHLRQAQPGFEAGDRCRAGAEIVGVRAVAAGGYRQAAVPCFAVFCHDRLLSVW